MNNYVRLLYTLDWYTLFIYSFSLITVQSIWERRGRSLFLIEFPMCFNQYN